jgi:lipoprotein-anchoring transpeptidase ErfK/SrfK
MNNLRNITVVGAAMLAATVSTAALANPFAFHSRQAMPQYEAMVEEPSQGTEMPAHLKRQIVGYNGHEAAGTVIIDTAHTHLYFVLGAGRAIRYGIGVGRDGFRWSGVHSISKKAEWPDWNPPADMLARQPYLPRFMAGGPGNPLGARAMYLGNTIYRIHGTNAPTTIGGRVSSGCIRLTNEDVADLYSRVNVGTKVVVLNGERQAVHSTPIPATSYAPTQPSRASALWQTIR